jgi:uncharacterized protein (TIGR02145 family)
MKTKLNSEKTCRNVRTSCLIGLIVVFTAFVFSACQKDKRDLIFQDVTDNSNNETTGVLKCFQMGEGTIYFGHKIFRREKGSPVKETIKLENKEFNCFTGKFFLHISNGTLDRFRTASAEIRIDGVLIAGPRDFSKKVSSIIKLIPHLTAESVLEVRLTSNPGSYIDLWIEGRKITITPVFTQIDTLLEGSVPPELPLVSNNGIKGTWDPSSISTAQAGNFAFIFAPDSNQCAKGAAMNIIVKKKPVSDADGYVYKTILIGTQLWMAENIRTTRYNNGDLIETTTPAKLDISGQSDPKYQWAVNGDESTVGTYGRIYTWYAANDSRGVCPAGWHLPTDAEWTVLSDYLTNNGYGFEGSGGDIAKSLAANSGWWVDLTPGNIGNDEASNNSSGFSAISAGDRTPTGVFEAIGSFGSWWSSTENGTNGWYRALYKNRNYLVRSNSNKIYGATVRCVKDN